MPRRCGDGDDPARGRPLAEKDANDAAVDERGFREIDDDYAACGDGDVELRLDTRRGGDVVFSAQGDHRHIEQILDDDLADLWHARPFD